MTAINIQFDSYYAHKWKLEIFYKVNGETFVMSRHHTDDEWRHDVTLALRRVDYNPLGKLIVQTINALQNGEDIHSSTLFDTWSWYYKNPHTKPKTETPIDSKDLAYEMLDGLAFLKRVCDFMMNSDKELKGMMR